jgi:hypothetical protein
MQTETMGREYSTGASNYSRPQPNEVDTSKVSGPTDKQNKEDGYLLQMAEAMTPEERQMFCEICEELNSKQAKPDEEAQQTPDSEAGGQVSGDNSDNNQMTS